MTKKQKLVKSIVAAITEQHQLNDVQLTKVQNFINKRLDTHGNQGYLFSMVAYYKRQYVKAEDNIGSIAEYVVENNFI